MLLDTLQERGLAAADVRWGDPDECRFPLFDLLRPLPVQWMCVLYLLMIIGLFFSACTNVFIGVHLYVCMCVCLLVTVYVCLHTNKCKSSGWIVIMKQLTNSGIIVKVIMIVLYFLVIEVNIIVLTAVIMNI